MKWIIVDLCFNVLLTCCTWIISLWEMHCSMWSALNERAGTPTPCNYEMIMVFLPAERAWLVFRIIMSNPCSVLKLYVLEYTYAVWCIIFDDLLWSLAEIFWYRAQVLLMHSFNSRHLCCLWSWRICDGLNCLNSNHVTIDQSFITAKQPLLLKENSAISV